MRRLEWIGSAKKDLLALPEEVVDVFGYALYQPRNRIWT
jgi:phage-related protein